MTSYTLPIGKAFKGEFPSGGILTQEKFNRFSNNNMLELIDLHLPTHGEVVAAPDQQATFKTIVLDKLRPYIGKDISTIPDNMTVDLPFTLTAWEPFKYIIPGVPNPGVDPSTGATPIDNLGGFLAPIGEFFGFLFSAGGLALIGGVVLLFLGYKALTSANDDATTA